MPSIQILCMKMGLESIQLNIQILSYSLPFSPGECPPSFVPASSAPSEVEIADLEEAMERLGESAC